MHVILLSGMDAESTSKYLKINGFGNQAVFENQICRFTKVLDGSPTRITIWVMLNTKLTQYMLKSIEYRIKYVVFLYHANKPITLLRALGWFRLFEIGDRNMVLCSTLTNTPHPTTAYAKLIGTMVDKFKTYDGKIIPHYSISFNKLIKLFE